MTGRERLTGIGLSLREALPPGRLMALAEELDEIEGSTLWCPEFAIRDAFSQLAFVAARTRHLRLATGIAPMAARTPAATALATATLDELSLGRMVLGVGVGHPTMSGGWHGQEHGSSLQWASDYLTVLRQALGGLTTDWPGQEAASTGFRLLTGGAPDVPVVLAALGPKMLGVAARLADGVLLNWTTPESARASIETVTAATDAGREPLQVGGYLRIAAGPDAAAQAYAHTAFYAELPAYRKALLSMGFGTSRDLADEAARELVLHGRVQDIVSRAQEWRDAGVDPLVIYPVGDEASIDEAIRLAVEVVRSLASSQRPVGSTTLTRQEGAR
ncbi:MAG: LLM class flavin-dependent oxidoreductase [Mycobacteriales bacterium]